MGRLEIKDLKGEKERVAGMFRHEKEIWASGITRIAGLDEAGRGPLAGPVIAAAVIFPDEIFIAGVNDSKLLSAAQRESLHDRIMKEAADIGIGSASPEEIDRLNILRASFLAMRRALENMILLPQCLLVDGNQTIPNYPIPQRAIVKGDRYSFSIAAASIIAKVTRDRIMQDYHQQYPQYHFDRHKGYPSVFHREAIKTYGYCNIHRLSFKVKLK